MNMPIRVILRAAVVLAVTVVFSPTAFCATRTWDAGGGNNLWSNPTNWSGNSLPGTGDDVVITNATSFDSVDLNLTVSVKSIDIGNGVTLNVQGNRTLSIANSSIVQSGGDLQLEGANPTLSGNGSLTVNGTMGIHGNSTVGGSGALTIGSTGELEVGSTDGSAVITISRNITNNSGGEITINGVADTTFGPVTITNAGTIDIQTNDDLVGSATINNNSGGLIKKSVGGGVTEIDFEVNNNAGASIQVQIGDIALNGGGDVSGAYSIAAASILSLTGVFNMSGTPTVTGAGTFLIDAGATLVVGAGVNVTCPNVTVSSGGTITGAGNLHVSGNFTWSGGTISGSGTRVLNSTSTPTISCSVNCSLDGATLQLQASGTYSASSNTLVFSNGASLTIAAGKTLSITNDGDFSSGVGGGSISNNGTIRKQTATGTSSIGVPVTLSGTSGVDIDFGTLQFGGGATVAASATIDIATGTQLEVTGGVFQFNSGSVSMPGSGDFKVSAGTLRVSTGPLTIPNVTLRGSGVIDGAGALHVSGSFGWVSGTIAGSGGRVLTSTSVPALSCFTGNCSLDGATLQLQASGTYSASSNALAFSNGASLTIAAGKTLSITNNGDFSSGVGGGSISNSGTIRKQTTVSTSTIGVPVTLSGTSTVDIDFGTLQFGGGATVAASATLDIAASATLDIAGGVFQFNSGSVSMPGSGDFKVSAGTLRVSTGPLTIPNVTLQGSGVIDGAGALNVSGNFGWAGGTIAGSGAKVLTSTSTPTISCGAACTLDGATLQLQASGTYSASSNALTFSNGASLTIAAGKTLSITNGGDFSSGVGGGSISNNGTIRKQTFVGTSTIGVPVALSGTSTVDIDTGTLEFGGGATVAASATLDIAAGTMLDVTGGVFQFNSGSVPMPGSGDFKVSSGTLRVPTAITMTIPKVTLQGSGVIDGGGTLILSGTSSWTGGTMGSAAAPGGITQINSGNTLNILGSSSPQSLTQTRQLLNGGTLSYGGISLNTLTMSGSSTITNNGTFNLINNSVIDNSPAGSALIENNGTFARSSGTGGSTLFPRVENNNGATLSAIAGTSIQFFGGGIAAGAYAISSGADFTLAAGTFTVASTATVTGAGTLSIAGATFDAGAGVDVTCPNLTLSGGTITGPGTVRVSGNFTWSGGTIAGSGPRVLNSTSTPTILCNVGIDCLLDGAALQLQASTTYSPSTNAVVFANGASLTIAAGKTLSFTNSGDFLSGFGGGSISNNGTISKITSAGTSSIGVPLNNNSGGTVSVNAGTLQFAGGVDVAASATIAVAAGQTLEVTGGVFVFNGTGSMPVSGNFKVSAGTLRVPTSVTITMPNVTLQGSGVIDGAGTLVLSGTSTWAGGTMGSATAPGGITQINSGNTLNITSAGPQSLTQGRELLNSGTVNYGGASTLTLSLAGKITNNAAFHLTADGNINLSGSGTIDNNGTGTLDKSGGSGTSTLFPTINSAGMLSATAGTLALAGGGTLSANVVPAAPATIAFPSGTHSIPGTIAGSGTIAFSGGAVTVGSPFTIGTLSVTAGTATLDANGSADAFTMTGGTLGGSGTLTLTDGGTWSGGTMSGSGTTVNPATKSLGISAPVTLNSRTLQNDGTLSVSDNVAGSGTIANNGTLNAAGNVTIGAVVNNGGQIDTSGALSLTAGGTHSGSFTVTAPGSMAFPSGTHSMSGGGSIGGTGTLTFSGATATVGVPLNVGTLSVSAGTATLNANGSADAFTMTGGTLGGSGMFTLTNGGTWSGGTMSGSGVTFNPVAKTLSIPAPVTLSSRTLQNNGTLSVSGNVTGSGTIANNGTINAVGTGTVGVAVNNGGQVATSVLLTLSGDGTHNGTFTVTAPGVIDFSGGTQTISGTLAGTGTVRFSGAAATVSGTWSGVPIEVTGGSVAFDTNGTIPALTLSGGTLAGTGDVTIAGPSTWSGGTIAGSGALTFDTGATVTMSGTSATTLARPLLNQGTINFTAASNGLLIAGVAVTNNGTVDIQSSQGIAATPGTPPFTNAGTLKKSSAGVMQFAAPLLNSGLVRIESGTMQFSGTYAQTAGTTAVLPGATLQTATLSLEGGSLTGNGTVAGTVANNATVSPGASPGTLTINGDYVQSRDGALDIQLGGTAPAQYDRLVVSGSVTLSGGTLNVTPSSGFIPTAGNAFQILTFGSRTNNSTFAIMNGLTGSGTVLVPTFSPTDLQLITNNIEADLSVSVSAPPSVPHGGAFAYTVNVFNGGGSDAYGVSFSAALPPNVTFTGATPAVCSGPPSLVCSIGPLTNQSTVTVLIGVTAGGVGAAPISAVATASEPDPNTANNTATATLNINRAADLRVAVTGPASTIAGSPAIYTIVVTNDGPDAAESIAVSASASAGLAFSENSGACTGSFPCTISALASGQSATIKSAWNIASSATGSVQLAVNAESPVLDTNRSNDAASATTLIGTCPAIIINAPKELTSGANAAVTATPLEGATYDWSIDNGTIDSGDGTPAIIFTAGQAGTTRLAVNVTGGGCTLSEAFDVTVKPRLTCVGTATPTEPADGTAAADAVAFGWSEVDDASGYRLWLQQGDAPAQSLGTTLGTSQTKIIPPGVYRWYVETLFDGCASHESERRALTILPAPDCASRGAPQLSAPASDIRVTSAAVAFSWNAVDKALEYELWLAPAGGVPTLIRTTAETSATATVPPGRLEWYVRALFAGCAARKSAHRGFSYIPPIECIGQQPLLIAPMEGERLTSPVSFEWRAVPAATSYELYIDGGRAATTASPHASGIPVPLGARSWQVRARLAEDCGALDSAESRFVVIAPPPSCAPLEAPVISAPAQISSGIAGRIQWSFVAGATAYVVEISGDSRFPRQSTSSTTVTAQQERFSFANQSSEPVARYVRVYAVDTNCVQPVTGPFSPVAVLFVLPPSAGEGAALMTDPTDVPYTLSIAAELAGRSFTATPTVPWLTVTPASGIVPPGGQTLRAVADTRGLPPGTSTGTVAITTAAADGTLTTLDDTSRSSTVSFDNLFGGTTNATSTPPPDALIIPAVASVRDNTITFSSNIRVTNTSAQMMKYEINFVPSGPAGLSKGQKVKAITIDSGKTVAMDNILEMWFGGTASTGTLEIRPDTATNTRTTYASSRTYSEADGGTYGQYIPALPYANFVAMGRTLSLQHIAQSDKYRTNLGLIEGSGAPVSVQVRIFDAAGTERAFFNRDLTGGERAQVDDVLKVHDVALDDGRIEVEVTSGAGKVTAYASVIDTDTNDSQHVPPVTLDNAKHSKWVLPGVADLVGGSGNWQTDARIFNAGKEAVELTLDFYSKNGGLPRTGKITLAPGEVWKHDRVLSLFGISGDAGALHVSSAAPAQVVVTARTYNQTEKGAYGQFISAATRDEAVAVGSPPLQILQMEESAGFKANIGFAEVSGKNPVTLKVEVFQPNSSEPAVLEVKLEPNQFKQLDSLLSSVALSGTFNARISVSAVAGGGEGRALAYGSLIDLKTGDPTYIPGQ